MFEELIRNFHFLRPWILLLLFVPLFFYFYLFKNVANLSSWEKVCDKKLLEFLLVKGKSSKRKTGVFLMYLGLVCAVVSAAGPTWKRVETNALNNQNPVMVVLNLSSDMLQTDIKPDRLQRAKIEITQLLNKLQSSETGLIVYTQEPFLISPLSVDNQLIINLLDAISTEIMPVNGDRLDRAIALAIKSIKDAGYLNGTVFIYTGDVGMNFGLCLDEANKAKRDGYTINIVNMSMQKNSKLEQIAQAGNGDLFEANDDIGLIVNKILANKNNFQKGKNKTSDWQDYGWYLMFIPMLCVLNFFRKGVFGLILFLCVNSTAQAGFLFSDNQLAMKDFESKKYAQAAQKFDDYKWKAAAYYKSGDFENTIKLLADKKDLQSMYNYGNALAKSGKLDDAIKAYEKVLEQNKDHADAKFNLEYLKKQQQQNNSKNQKQDKKQDNQKNKNQNQQDKEKNNNQSEQNQTAEQEQNQNEDKNNQEVQAQNAMASAQAQDEQENEESKDNSKENQENNKNTNMNKSTEEQQIPRAQSKTGPEDEKYDEEVQARTQKFREIPEDKGGLLKAFIQKEYSKNRYGE